MIGKGSGARRFPGSLPAGLQTKRAARRNGPPLD